MTPVQKVTRELVPCATMTKAAEDVVTRIDLDTLRRTPAYPLAEAAHYLGLPTSTLRSWCVGQGYLNTRGQPKRFINLIDLDGEPSDGLSLLNVVEEHVLTSIRRAHGI